MRTILALLIAVMTATLCACVSDQNPVLSPQQDQNWHALKRGMTENQVDMLIGPLSQMQTNGAASFSPQTRKGMYHKFFRNSAFALQFTNDRLVNWVRNPSSNWIDLAIAQSMSP
jgi:hypothetical protein